LANYLDMITAEDRGSWCAKERLLSSQPWSPCARRGTFDLHFAYKCLGLRLDSSGTGLAKALGTGLSSYLLVISRSMD